MSQSDQQENLTRVSEVIGQLVMNFYRSTLETGAPWHMGDLTKYVAGRTTTAPDSAGRILRSLRQSGKLNYVVLSRSESLYESLPLVDRKPAGSVGIFPVERHGS